MTNREALMRHLERMDDEEMAECISNMCKNLYCGFCIFRFANCVMSKDPNEIYEWLGQESAEND